ATFVEKAQEAFSMRMGQEVRRRGSSFNGGSIEIARDSKEAFGLEEPPARDLRQPAGAKRHRQPSSAGLERGGMIDGHVAFAAAGIVVACHRCDPFKQG